MGPKVYWPFLASILLHGTLIVQPMHSVRRARSRIGGVSTGELWGPLRLRGGYDAAQGHLDVRIHGAASDARLGAYAEKEARE